MPAAKIAPWRWFALTEAGAALMPEAQAAGAEITRRTLAPLSARDQARLIGLLRRIAD